MITLTQTRSMIIIFDNNDFVSVLMVVTMMTLYVRMSHLRLGETKSTAEPPPAESASTFTELSTIFNSSSQNCNDLLPPKLQRRGLVFKCKMGYYGACMMGYNG